MKTITYFFLFISVNLFSQKSLEKIEKLIDSVPNHSMIQYDLLSYIKSNPEDCKAKYLLAEYYINEGKPSLSYEYLNNCESNYLDQPNYFWLRSKAVLSFYSRNYEIIKGSLLAISDIDRVIGLGVNTATVYKAKASLYLLIVKEYLIKIDNYKIIENKSFEDVKPIDERQEYLIKAKEYLKISEDFVKITDSIQTIDTSDLKSELKYYNKKVLEYNF